MLGVYILLFHQDNRRNFIPHVGAITSVSPKKMESRGSIKDEIEIQVQAYPFKQNKVKLKLKGTLNFAPSELFMGVRSAVMNP
jgi:hypothetical protein